MNAPFSRRQMVQALGGGFGSLALAQLHASAATVTPTQPLLPHFAPKAKHIIHLFMNGGPFQCDLFDPKPALNKFAGQKPPLSFCCWKKVIRIMYIYAYACLYIYVSIPAWRPGTRAIGGTWGRGCGGNWQRRSPSVSLWKSLRKPEA